MFTCYLYIYLSVHVAGWLPVWFTCYLYIYISVQVAGWLPVWFTCYLYIYLSVQVAGWLPVWLTYHLYIYPSVYTGYRMTNPLTYLSFIYLSFCVYRLPDDYKYGLPVWCGGWRQNNISIYECQVLSFLMSLVQTWTMILILSSLVNSIKACMTCSFCL